MNCVRRILYTGTIFALSLAAGLSSAERRTPDAAVGRAVIDRVSGLAESKRLRVSVPIAVLESYERSRFREAAATSPAAPVDVVVSRWEAAVPVSDEEILVQLMITGTALNASPSEPARLRLFPTDVAYQDIRLDGEPCDPLSTNDWFEAVLPAPGTFRIEARLPTRVTKAGGNSRLRFHKGPSTVTLVKVDSDRSLDVRIDGAPNPILGSQEEGTHGFLAAGSASHFDLLWKEHRKPAAREGMASITPSVAWSIGERTLSANALLEVAILGGKTDSVILNLPAGSDNVRVSGPDVKDHRLNGTGLEVFFGGAIGGRTKLQIAFDCPRPRGDVVVCPGIGIANGRIDSGGWLLVANDAGGELLENDVGGLAPASALDLPREVAGLLAGKPLFVFKRGSRQPRQTFDLVTTTPFPMAGTIADRAEILCVIRPSGDEIARAHYSVRNSAGQYLRVRLPEGSSLLSVTVEEKPSQVSRDGGLLLIPMPRSVQTLSGLVSFPVEIVYCRSADPLAGKESRLCALPVLADVPVAQVQATLMHPRRMRIADYRSVLTMTESFTEADGTGITYGYGYANDTVVTAPEATVNLGGDLAYNYYTVGYEAYKEGRLEEAEEYLSNVVDLHWMNGRAKDAQALVENIKLGRGEVGRGRDKTERAKVSNLQRGLATGNVKLEAEQHQLITAGIDLIDRGDEEAGAELLKGAEAIGKKLGQRSVSKVKQKALSSQYFTKLKQTEKQLEENRMLQKRLSKLQDETQKIVVDGKAQSGLSFQFGKALEKAAREQQVEVVAAQHAAFDVNLDGIGQQQPQPSDVNEFFSRSFKKQPQQQRGGRAKPAPSRKPSLSRRNVDLEKQVKAIEQALGEVQELPGIVQAGEPHYTEAQLRDVREQAGKARRKAEVLRQQITRGTRPAARAKGQNTVLQVDDFGIQLHALEQWSGANRWAFDAPDKRLRKDLDTLTRTITEAKDQLKKAQEGQKDAARLQVDFSGVANTRGWANQAAIERFVTDNYLGVVTNTTADVKVVGGSFVFGNEGRNADVLGTVVEKLEQNEGLVVRMSGRNVAVPTLGDIPLLGRLFESNTSGGQRYAVLDEAQYRTLLQTGKRAGRSGTRLPDSTSDYDRRDVVVGTPNTTAGQEFTLLQGGADYNGIMVDGTRVDLPHHKYLAIDNGGYVTVLKGTEMRDWMEHVQDSPEPAAAVVEPFRVPVVGLPVRFEKTYLEAGESPGIMLTYTYSERSRS